MKLDIKSAFKNTLSLKYFWLYLFIFVVLTTLSSIFQSANGLKYHTTWANIMSILTYISLGYLYIMVHNRLNDNDLNNENETFWQNFSNSALNGFKCFVGIFVNTIFVFLLDLLLLVPSALIYTKVTGAIITEMNIFSFVGLNCIFAVVILLSVCLMLFVIKLLPIAFSEEYKLKDMFCYRKVLKRFLNKENVGSTLAILGLYVLTVIILFALMFGVMFLLNLGLIAVAKTLLTNHYVLVAFLINVSSVISPFLVAFFHFFIISIAYNLLADVYKKKEVEVLTDITENTEE